MVFNLLATVEDPMRTVSIGEAALYALLGFAVVFFGIALLIFIVWLFGKVITKLGDIKNKTTAKKQEKASETAQELAIAQASDEISEETIAAITAAVMAYYQNQNPKCEFTVKRIKRI